MKRGNKKRRARHKLGGLLRPVPNGAGQVQPAPGGKTKSNLIAVGTILELTQERMKLLAALRDLLAFYDKLDGHAGELGVGWGTRDVKRLDGIRQLVKR